MWAKRFMCRGGFLLAAILCTVTVISAPSASASAPAWPSGAFAGYGPSGIPAFASWRGAAVRTATDFIGADDWSQIENPAWTISQWGAVSGVRPILSVAMWPWSGGSLAEAATGAYNSHFSALARNLVAGGLGSAGIRLAWEFNATWYRWSVQTSADAANFAAAWRQIVGAMQSVPGASFTFDWAPNLQAGGINPALAYPGDAYVSEIGMDVYDWNESGPGETAMQRWNDIVNKGYGLAWQANFASAHHKPIAFPEWGLVHYALNPGLAGGDDPLFVENMYAWFKTHTVAFENYFDSDAPAISEYFGITTGTGLFPNAAAVYQRLYSGQALAAAPGPVSANTCKQYRSRVLRSVRSVATVTTALAALSGCGQSAQVKLQQDEITYQTQIGRINKTFVHPPASAARQRALLSHAISRYAALHPPAPLRKLHRQVLSALRDEHRALTQAASTSDPGRIHAAESRDARARLAVTRALNRIARVIGACRADAAHC